MNEWEFEESYDVGDRVILIREADGPCWHDHGTVVCTSAFDTGVCWDTQFPHGHDLDGRCEDGHGWWVANDCIALLPSRFLENEKELSDDIIASCDDILSLISA